jgi:hypothetical protein
MGSIPFQIFFLHAVNNHMKGHANHTVDTQRRVGHIDLTVKEIMAVSVDKCVHYFIILCLSYNVYRMCNELAACFGLSKDSERIPD